MALRRSGVARGGGGGMMEQMFPGYKDKLWAKYPPAVKSYFIQSECSAWEKPWAELRSFQPLYLKYKGMEAGFKPSAKFREPYVDWQRQIARGTMHTGRWYEGPYGTDYTPGNTHDRLDNVKAPFTAAEWEERKQYRSWDLLTVGAIFVGGFVYYRLSTETPVVWCEEMPKKDD